MRAVGQTGEQVEVGLELDQLLQGLAVSAVLEAERSPVQGVGHVDEQFVAFEGLDHIAHGTKVQSFLGRVGVVEPRDHDGGGVRVDLRQVAQQVQARFAGHADVAEHHLDLMGGQELAGGGSVGGFLAVVAGTLEQSPGQAAQGVLVVDNQNAGSPGAGGGGSGSPATCTTIGSALGSADRPAVHLAHLSTRSGTCARARRRARRSSCSVKGLRTTRASSVSSSMPMLSSTSSEWPVM